jgi:hypothetical protein
MIFFECSFPLSFVIGLILACKGNLDYFRKQYIFNNHIFPGCKSGRANHTLTPNKEKCVGSRESRLQSNLRKLESFSGYNTNSNKQL